MDSLLRFMVTHFWLLAILTSFTNVLQLKIRSRPFLEKNPDLAPGYRNLMLGQLTVLNVPWLVMGVAVVLGGVPGVFHFLRPGDGDPWVIAVHVSLILLWAGLAVWVYAKGGAGYIARHPGLLGPKRHDERAVKLLVGVMLLGGLAAEIMMWLGLFPTPALP